MTKNPTHKYKPHRPIALPDRTWPNNTISKTPTWCSVDLRDGNQALVTPMSLQQKLRLFDLLVDLGFKEIEVGFPSAAQVELDFLRTLIDTNRIPKGVVVQVLTQAREHLIEATCQALEGCDQAILHIYNSTSILQRDIVFKKDKQAIMDIAIQGIKWTKKYVEKYGLSDKITLEYSPESFTGTEIDYAIDVCNAVIKEWGGTKPIIINLPATVELFTPNVYADMIEWSHRNLIERDRVILSLHTHNDRGTGVAATELGLMAGAQRVEGTLFGNGERTGNVDIITTALNMMTQGVDTGLTINNINEVMEIYSECTNMDVHSRHPYAGELVFTAFSGSHQDAIKKGMADQTSKDSALWEVPYLPIDPTDIGRSYEAIIRINSQSGKGGVAYVMETEYGCQLPKDMHPDFGKVIQSITDKTGKEIQSESIWTAFQSEYINNISPIQFQACDTSNPTHSTVTCQLTVTINEKDVQLSGEGNGPIDACRAALANRTPTFKITTYSEHSLNEGSSAKAIAYIQIENESGQKKYGAGIDANINIASIKALICAVNRSFPDLK
ncbi:2-isopropylmalate synthase [bacterium]|jgi:2-isopropylmalate synthase|nr:2-isopropylmalate synthase [bacterium]